MNIAQKTAIENALLKYPKARRLPVENVICSWPSSDRFANSINLEQDARLYNWRKDGTYNAIKYAMRSLNMI